MASGFVSSSVVSWSGAPRTTTCISATQLTASITSADIAAAGTAQVSGFNPVLGGGASTAVTLTINLANQRRTLRAGPVVPQSESRGSR